MNKCTFFCFYFYIRPRQFLAYIKTTDWISLLAFTNTFIHNASSMICSLVFFKVEKEHKNNNKVNLISYLFKVYLLFILHMFYSHCLDSNF